ncbi:MAG: restriction endonuclease subunit S [Planctomycetia bacterium]|nr:restriction endonuclease subunit S [Planctomycetia bacterium]
MHSLRRYVSYESTRDSQVRWIGKVPAHWSVKTLNRDGPVLRGSSPRPIDSPDYFDDEGEYAWVRIEDVTSSSDGYLRTTTQRLSPLGASYSRKLAPGQLFLSMAATVGKPCITAIQCCIHDGFVYFPYLRLYPRFAYYVFASGELFRGEGKLGTQLNLNTQIIGALRVPVPPPDEQRAIAAFLDREMARIDALIDKKQRLIELLQEKRTALISHAVTKGLLADVPTRPSGVPWLGQVPGHWQVKRLKFAVTFQRGHDLPTVDRTDGEVPVVTSAGSSGLHDKATAKGPGIVTGRYGTIGTFHLIDCDYWPLNTTLYSIDLHGNRPRFLWYMLHVLTDVFLVNSTKSAVPGVDRSDLHQVLVAVPPDDEQAAIAQYLDEECRKFERLSAAVFSAIERLREYRSALISATVTGTIDVRNG